MADTSIRPVTIAEQARLAAQKFVDTGEPQPNPHLGGATNYADAHAWHAAYCRYILMLSAEREGIVLEGSA